MVYCRKITSTLTNDRRPFFIFTSRNREALKNVSLLDLDVLTKEEAVTLIVTQLFAVNKTKHTIEELAETLQYLPLALQQAIAYIKERQKIESISGKNFNIENYLEELTIKKQDLLDYQFPDDFGEFEKTTFKTLDVTLDVIKSHKKDGSNAILILQHLSYLYADKINTAMFLSLFQNDSMLNGGAFSLLEKYSMITRIDATVYQIHRVVQAVIALKYAENETKNLEQGLKLVDPELYLLHPDPRQVFDSTQNISMEKLLHYYNLEIHIHKHRELDLKCVPFYRFLHQRILFSALLSNELEKIKIISISESDVKLVKQMLVALISMQNNDVIKYFIDKNYLTINEDVNQFSIHCFAIMENNIDLFKFLIEKGVDFPDCLKHAPIELIRDTIAGELDSVIVKISEMNLEIMQETLFFAALFGQTSIVQLLIDHQVSQNARFHEWFSIYPAIKYNYEFLDVFLQRAKKEELNATLFHLLSDKQFIDEKSFEKIFNCYCEKCDDTIDRNAELAVFLVFLKTTVRSQNRLPLEKESIIRFLLEDQPFEVYDMLQNLKV